MNAQAIVSFAETRVSDAGHRGEEASEEGASARADQHREVGFDIMPNLAGGVTCGVRGG